MARVGRGIVYGEILYLHSGFRICRAIGIGDSDTVCTECESADGIRAGYAGSATTCPSDIVWASTAAEGNINRTGSFTAPNLIYRSSSNGYRSTCAGTRNRLEAEGDAIIVRAIHQPGAVGDIAGNLGCNGICIQGAIPVTGGTDRSVGQSCIGMNLQCETSSRSNKAVVRNGNISVWISRSATCSAIYQIDTPAGSTNRIVLYCDITLRSCWHVGSSLEADTKYIIVHLVVCNVNEIKNSVAKRNNALITAYQCIIIYEDIGHRLIRSR